MFQLVLEYVPTEGVAETAMPDGMRLLTTIFVAVAGPRLKMPIV